MHQESMLSRGIGVVAAIAMAGGVLSHSVHIR